MVTCFDTDTVEMVSMWVGSTPIMLYYGSQLKLEKPLTIGATLETSFRSKCNDHILTMHIPLKQTDSNKTITFCQRVGDKSVNTIKNVTQLCIFPFSNSLILL